jgi:hypothetical protein
MKYLVIDQRKYDEFVEEFSTKEEAIAFADDEWERMAKADKDSTVAFYVLESVNPDPDSEDHYDGDFAKTYKREGKV